ncbi:hypothetical protein ACFOYU_05495 [Microvirga sp. GCM10011540]|uniref:hypothetical protein n=1 Tax=Microvirga sp. GCM10011540 TaxID=3317338 RepID=UPI003620851A
MMHPNAAATVLAYGMTGMVMDLARASAKRRQAQTLAAWENALYSAEGSADAMADVAIAAIGRVSELEDEIARLHRALRHRDEALAALAH